jgi:hypothetical protein
MGLFSEGTSGAIIRRDYPELNKNPPIRKWGSPNQLNKWS